MKCHIEILGVHSKLTSPSLMLAFERQKYIFNCGQNLPRSLAHSNFRNNIKDVFVTGINLDAVSSLRGLISHLVLDSKQTFKRRIHGPVGIKAIADIFRNTKFDVIEYGNQELGKEVEDSYIDDNIKVKALSFNSGKYYTFYSSESKRLEFAEDSCASYIVQCKKQARKFLVEKAEELGIPRGKLYAKLVKGNSITLDNGKVIYPDDVLGPPTKSQVFGVIYMPSTKYLLSEVSKTISSYFNQENDFDYIFHMSPTPVLLHSDYHKFLDTLPPHISNVVFNENISHSLKNTLISPIYSYSDDLLIKLQKVFPKYFKCSTNMYPAIDSDHADFLKFQFKNLLIPKSGLRIHLNPPGVKGNIEMSESINPLNIQKMHDKAEKIALPDENRINNIPYSSVVNTKIKGSDPSILILGTSSAKPDQFRSVSSIWVGDFGSSFLFDCGEGTYGQLCRHFGDNIDKALVKIKTIFISHLHEDHHSGIAKLVHERSKLTSEPLNIVAHGKFQYDLETFKTIFAPFNYNFYSSLHTPRIPGIKLIKFVPTIHNTKSHGIIIIHESGWKIVYSGDTRPCEDLVNEGKDATLLIHEATFIDKDLLKAQKYFHSTVGEAIKVGKKMNAWRILLTHFSRTNPYCEVNKDYDLKGSIIGFDLMKFKLSKSYEVAENTSKILKIYEETRNSFFAKEDEISEEEE
ncbi:unnamed protein product [Blepharisma stoltei]|uniref:ribonuclease Z n=1 Tax=Blepharisma stoltei TaxID=1481888 RepID=A0AAU9K584_9CILI|nr:unnamed protein product [Blepharisma stoltei]